MPSDYDNLFDDFTAKNFQPVTAAADFSSGPTASSDDLAAILALNESNTNPAIPPSAVAAVAASPTGQSYRGPSTSMAEANAFIRANRGQRDGEGNQVAALLRPTDAAGAVNANTDKYGVSASYDERGNLSLTNIGVQAATPVYPTGPNGMGPGTGAIAPNTPLAVNSLFMKLKGASTVDDARGILYSLREASAIQATQFETQAMQYAENQFGIPLLTKQLQEAQAADLSDPKYLPGMGDSPITRQIRNTMEDAKLKAMNASKVYLNNNPSYAVLKSTLANAETEVARITKNQDRSDTVEDRLSLVTQEQKNRRADQMAESYAGLDEVQKQRLNMFNPGLQKTDANDLPAQAMVYLKGKEKDKAFIAAFQAPEADLPRLALSGNSYATSLVVSKEETNAGVDPTLTQAKLENLRKAVATPGFLQKALQAELGDTEEGRKKMKTQLAEINEKNTTTEGKAQVDALKYQMALNMAKKATTVDFANNLGRWKTQNPLGTKFNDAVAQTRQTTQSTKMLDVLNAFVGGATGEARVQLYKEFTNIMEENASTSINSIFGSPDSKALKSQIAKSSAKSLFDIIGGRVKAAGDTITPWTNATMGSVIPGTAIIQGITNEASPVRKFFHGEEVDLGQTNQQTFNNL